MIDRRVNSEWTVAGWLALMVTIMVALAALTPYVVTIPKDNLNLITQAQTTLWNGWLVVLSYYFGTTQSQGRKDVTISTLADTAKSAQAALAPAPGAPQGEVVEIKPDETLTVKGTDP